MNNSQIYEKVVKVASRGRHLSIKISVILSYAAFAIVWLSAAVMNIGMFVPILLAGILSTALLVILTWKYIQLEYEYSFCCGTLTLSKVYGKKSIRKILQTEIKDMIFIASATEENINKAERFEIEKRISAVSSENAENVWLAVTGGKDEIKCLIFLEADDRVLSILKSANPYAFGKRI